MTAKGYARSGTTAIAAASRILLGRASRGVGAPPTFAHVAPSNRGDAATQRSAADPRKRMTKFPPTTYASPVSEKTHVAQIPPSTTRESSTPKNTAILPTLATNATTSASTATGTTIFQYPGSQRTSNTRRIAGPSTSSRSPWTNPSLGPSPGTSWVTYQTRQGIAVAATTAVTTPSAGQALRHSRADATSDAARSTAKSRSPSRFVSTIPQRRAAATTSLQRCRSSSQ